MFSMWEKVSGAIMDAPTLGSTACVASGKSMRRARGPKKAARCAGRRKLNGCLSGVR
jgi:hypothetical protein